MLACFALGMLLLGATGTARAQAVGETVVTVHPLPEDMKAYTDTIPGTLVTFEMVPVPGGTLTVQTEEGTETVEIDPFWISKTETTWDEFDIYAFVEKEEVVEGELIIRPSKPYGAPDRGFGHKGYAALSMSYGVAATYAQWLGLKVDQPYRIPTEAEWEFACRAGSDEDPGADEEALEEKAWFWDNAFSTTHPVGSLAPNAWGLHDMLGNAVEWCVGLDGEPLACGGHYDSEADEVSCTARMEPTPAWQETDPQIPKSLFWLTDATWIGFRIMREYDGPATPGS